MTYVTILIEPDGKMTREEHEQEPPLEQFSKWVGGYLELVPHFDILDGMKGAAFCDEDGMRKNLPANEIATMLWQRSAGVRYRHRTNLLLGNVVFCSPAPE